MKWIYLTNVTYKELYKNICRTKLFSRTPETHRTSNTTLTWLALYYIIDFLFTISLNVYEVDEVNEVDEVDVVDEVYEDNKYYSVD